MNEFSENKILKKKKLDKDLNLSMEQNERNGRIYVEFSTEDGRIRLQKTFQDTFDGNRDAKSFSKSIKSMKDLKKYFGLDKKGKK